MKLQTVLVAAAVLVTGCASTAPAQMYRPAGSTDAAWQIDGEFEQLGKKLTIRFNGETVLSGNLSFFGNTAELKGSYKEKPVSSSCSQSYNMWGTAKTQCFVFVNNERAATLQF